MRKRQPGKCWCGQDALPGAPLCKEHDGQAGIVDLIRRKMREPQ